MGSSQRNVLAAGIVAAVVAAAAWALFSRGNGNESEGADRDGTVDRHSERAAVVDSESSTEARGRPESSERTRLEERPPSSTELTVRVVDETDQPVPGAEVGAYIRREGEKYMRADLNEHEAWADKKEANARGEVRLPIRDGIASWTVYARHDDRWARLFVARRQAAGVKVLRLQRDLTFRVLVLDGAERPVAGLRVGLGDESELGRGTASLVETSGEDGVATFRHVQTRIVPRWGDDGVVMLGCPLAEPVYEKLRFATPPAEPIVLRLPATGSLHLKLIDERGQPGRDFLESVYATLRVRPRIDSESNTRERRYSRRFEGSSLTVPYVGLNLHVNVRLDSPEVSGGAEFAGPRVLGERIEKSITFERHPSFSGRLVDDRGVPQRGYWWATHVQAGRGYYNQYFETSSDGRFHAAMPKLYGSGATPRSIWFRRTLPDAKKQAWLDVAELELHAGRNELGDIVLRPPPLLIAGRVLDDAGNPVADATLTAYQGDPDSDVWTLPGFDESPHRSKADGTFSIRAHVVDGKLLLRASKERRYGDYVRFRRQGPPITCVLPRVGAAQMDVSFEGDLTKDAVLFFHRNAATGATRSVVGHYVLKGETVNWTGLKPGRYDFGVRLIGMAQPLVELSGVEIVAEETRRLPTQKLGRGLHPITINVVDSRGRPVDSASLVVDPRRLAGQPRAALAIPRTGLTLRTPTKPVELLVLAPGFRSQRLRGIDKSTTVRLSAGLEVRLEVQLPKDALAADQRLLPTIRRYDAANPDPQPWQNGHALYLRGTGKTFYPARHSWLWNQRVPVRRDGHLTLRVPAPGTYAIEWEITGSEQRELGAKARRVFRVQESTAPTRVQVRLSTEDMRK